MAFAAGALLLLSLLVGPGWFGSAGRTTPAPAPSSDRTEVPGWELDASTVGLAGAEVKRSSLPEYWGPVHDGSTLRLVKITRPLDLSELKDVTLDRVWLVPQGGHVALVLGPGSVVKDSDVDGSDMQPAERIGVASRVAGSYAIEGLSITGMSVGAWLDGPGTGTLADTYIHAMTSLAGAHVDGLTRRAGTGPLSVIRSRIDASGPSVTGALFLQSTWGDPIGGVTVQDTYLEGMGYVIGLDNHGQQGWVRMKNVRVRSTGWGAISTTGIPPLTGWAAVSGSPTR